VSLELDRRELLKGLALLPFAALQLPAAHPNGPVFFKPDEFATLDSLTEMIIPADEHSPGAHEVGVASYIDWSTAQAIEPEAKTSWTKGLKAVNDLCEELFQKSFQSATPEQRTEILNRFAGTKDEPTAEQARFWGQLKDTTAFVYYSSSIGIHQEMNYKGNVILEQFVGYDAT
jgi:Gluconate 2-dehydrogenase subunit 3